MSSMIILSGGLGGVLIAVVLVILLSVRELISTSSRRSSKILGTIDAIVIPLVLLFVASVVFQILEAAHLFTF
jgi:hypothetical protein